MKKKIFAVGILCVLVLSLCACGSKTETNKDSETVRTTETETVTMTEQEEKDVKIRELLLTDCFWDGSTQSLTLYEFFEDGTGFWYNGCCEFEEMYMAAFTWKVENGQVTMTLKPMYDGGKDKTFVCNVAFTEEERPDYFSTERFKNMKPDDVIIYYEDLEKDYEEVQASEFYDYCPFFLNITDKYSEHRHPDYLQKKAEWKTVMLNYIDNIMDESLNSGYDLIYLDDNDIPELLEYGNCEAVGCRLGIVSNGKVNVTQFSRLGYDYIERGNIVNNHGGLMGHYYDRIYSIKDGNLEQIFNGKYEDVNGVPTQDGNGNFIYQYSIDEEEVTKEVYEEKVESIIPTDSKAQIPNYGEYKSLEAVKKEIIFK